MKKIEFVLMLFGIIILNSMLFWRCQTEIDENYSYSDIIDSAEFEEYIIASTELQNVHNVLENELGRVDFTNLETVIGANGKEIKYLPSSIRSLNIEEKASLVVEKREVLLNKFPQFISMSIEEMSYYVDRCIKQSIKVSDYFLEKGINIHLPSTRFSPHENYNYNSTNQLVGALYNWTLSPDYVEVYVFFLANGSSIVYRDSQNDANNCYAIIQTIGNKHYFQGSAIQSISHTHLNGNNPSSNDIINKNKFPYCSHSIYHNGSFHSY